MAPDIFQDPSRAMSRSDYSRTQDGAYVSDTARSRDILRWGSIIAGVFCTLGMMVIMSVLGVAVGFSSLEIVDPAHPTGVGVGMWGGLTALVSFFFGGLMAARTTGLRVESQGLLHGALVWMVTLPVVLYLMHAGATSMFDMIGHSFGAGIHAAHTAWGALLCLLIGLGAACVGGHLGVRRVQYSNDSLRAATTLTTDYH